MRSTLSATLRAWISRSRMARGSIGGISSGLCCSRLGDLDIPETDVLHDVDMDVELAKLLRLDKLRELGVPLPRLPDP